MLISAFITHKKAETFKDCQDRFSVNPATKSIAVSDGLSQSIFQKIWANQLVHTYTDKFDWVPNMESVKELAPIWKNKVEEFIKSEEDKGNNPWRAKNSLAENRSAGATILGIRFQEQSWTFDVLGDSCLILINNNHIEEIITSEIKESFDNYPDYYDSNPEIGGKGELKTGRRYWNVGEAILLVSDPFADFLSKNKGTDKEILLVDKILGINSHEEFEGLVEEWRKLGMHNDDSTLVIIKQDGNNDFHLVPNCIDDITALAEVCQQAEENTSNAVNSTTTDSSLTNDSRKLKDFILWLTGYFRKKLTKQTLPTINDRREKFIAEMIKEIEAELKKLFFDK